MITNELKLEYFTYLVVAVSAVCTFICYYRQEHTPASTNEEIRLMFRKMLQRQRVLFSQFDLLSQHMGTYFQTLNEAGFSEIVKIRNQLLMANEDIKILMDHGRFKDARLLIGYIEHPDSKPFPELFSLTNARLESLYNWKERANKHITHCVIKLGIISAQPTANREREDMRRKTIHSLEQLRELINNDRARLDNDWA